MSLSSRRRFSSFPPAHPEEKCIVLLPCGSPTDGISYPDSLAAGVWLGRTSAAKSLYNPNGLVEKKYSPSLFSVRSPMSSRTRSMMAQSLSPLELLAPEILERIALSAAEEQLVGPPSILLPLLVTSKTINFALSPKKNNNLYAKIFAFKFDTAAASRRLSSRWLTSRSIALELRHRFEALSRVRRGIVDGSKLPNDLWTVFLVLLEHDHKNMLQLTEWARAGAFALRVAERWLNNGYENEFGENVGGLVCTIIWELVREGQLRTICGT